MEKLALLGGPKAVQESDIKPWPVITPKSYQALTEVLDSGVFHTLQGPQCEALSREFAEFCQVKHCVPTNSGTSALHLCLAAAGLEPGDEILLPAYTFWATAAACLHALTIPVFVDIDPETYTMDPALVEAKITPQTKALMPVHINGMPADLDPLLEIARRHDLAVLVDSCQAAGAEYKGKPVGGLGDAEGFSLNRSKTITGCEGGLFCTNNDAYYDYARMMTSFDVHDIDGQPRSTLGWGFRPLEFVNAFAREQLHRAPQTLQQRRELAGFLTEALRDLPGLRGPACPPDRNPCYFTYVMSFNRAEVEAAADLDDATFTKRATAALRAEGLPLGNYASLPIPAMPVFQQQQGHGRGYPWKCSDKKYVYDGDDYPVTQQFLATHMNLGGVYPPNDQALMQSFVAAMQKVMAQPESWVHHAPPA